MRQFTESRSENTLKRNGPPDTIEKQRQDLTLVDGVLTLKYTRRHSGMGWQIPCAKTNPAK